MSPSPLRRLSPALLALLAACASEKVAMDPLLQIQSPFGAELGVSTDYGVVFVGSRTRAGEIDVTAWFGDGPSIEPAVVEPVSDNLFTAEVEILLPWIPLGFQSPLPGDTVTVHGRVGREHWTETVKVVAHPSVTEGVLIPLTGRLADDPTQVGAAVVREENGEERLVGLVSGRLLLDVDGAQREYATVLGPEHLWPLVVHRRKVRDRRRWVYREDVL